MLEKAAKLANKTHKERVAEFNEKLEAMSEHHDIPRELAVRSLSSPLSLTFIFIGVGPG